MFLLSMLIKNRMETWRKFQERERVKFIGNAPGNVGLKWTFTDMALSSYNTTQIKWYHTNRYDTIGFGMIQYEWVRYDTNLGGFL